MKTSSLVRIGTRDSKLALWQATYVQQQLKQIGLNSTLVKIKSTGDLELTTPLYEMGITGVFTKALDVALLNNTIDIAVHSLKDVPTALPKGIVQYAIPQRGAIHDVLVKGHAYADGAPTVATGSLRRKAQWLNKYPNHNVVGLRGNVIKRLETLQASTWHGAIFAEAGLERLNINPQDVKVLDWMIPAPGQGALMIAGLENNTHLAKQLEQLNHPKTLEAITIERDFLRQLEGGCSAPIGAHAHVTSEQISFKGVLLSVDGKTIVSIDKTVNRFAKPFGKLWANEVLANGGEPIIKQIKEQQNL